MSNLDTMKQINFSQVYPFLPSPFSQVTMGKVGDKPDGKENAGKRPLNVKEGELRMLTCHDSKRT